MGLLQKCVDYLEKEKKTDTKFHDQESRKELMEIAKKLTSPEYSRFLYPLNTLNHFSMTGGQKGLARKVAGDKNNFHASVNAMAFFVAVLANELIGSDVKIDGKHPFIQVDSAIREDKEQQEKIKNAATEDKYKFASKSPHTNGSAIDSIWAKNTPAGLKPIPRTKDFLKISDGQYLPSDIQESIKQSYFVHYDTNQLDHWQEHFKGTALEDKAEKVISGFRKVNGKIWESPHIQLTYTAKCDPAAVDALYNVRWSDRFWAGMPFVTTINDENWHWQLRRSWEQFFKPITFVEYQKLDQLEVMGKAYEIQLMAKKVKDKAIYSKGGIVPNQRLALSKDTENMTPEELELLSSFGGGLTVIPNTVPELCTKQEFLADLAEIERKKHNAVKLAKLRESELSKVIAEIKARGPASISTREILLEQKR
jgi:hypothetical protein